MSRVSPKTMDAIKRIRELSSVPEDYQTHYVKLGRETYAMTKIEHPITEGEELIKQEFEERTKKLVKEYECTVRDIEKINFAKQLDVLRREREGKDYVKILTERWQKHLYIHNGELYEVRFAQYAPCIFTGSWGYFQLILERDGNEEHVKARTNKIRTLLGVSPSSTLDRGKKLIIRTKVLFDKPVALYYGTKSENLKTFGARLLHTTSDYGWCVGHNRSRDIWGLDQNGLSKFLNQINVDSLGSNEIILQNPLIGPRTSLNIMAYFYVENVLTAEYQKEDSWRV